MNNINSRMLKEGRMLSMSRELEILVNLLKP